MACVQKALRRLIRLLDHCVNLAALCMIMAMLGLGAYSIYDSNQVYQAAEAAQYEIYAPKEGETRSFEELQSINPEVFGWLRVNDTGIDYPVVQTTDNSKYVNHDVEGNYSLSGAIFLHCANAPDFTDFNSIFYGHHMEKSRMFGDLGRFVDKSYFDEHPYGNLFYQGRDHGIEFFAFLLVDAYDDIFNVALEEPEEQQAYLDRILNESIYIRDVGVTTADHIIMLSTCTSTITNGRHILIGRLTDEIYPEETSWNAGTGADTPLTWLERLPKWALYGIPAGLLAIILGITVLRRRHRKKRRRRGGKAK